MYIKRDLQDVLLKYLRTPEVQIILGPRQSGKSTLLEHISSNLSNVNMLTFEDVDIMSLYESDIKSFANLYVEGYRYVFIDEIQYAQSFGKNMKYLYDVYKDRVKFIVTGSSVTDFYLNGLKYLVGRIFVFHLYPFSFKEFLRYKNEKMIKLVDKMAIQTEMSKLVEEFIIYGGYPRVVLADDIDEKKMILKNLYSIMIQREITSLTKLIDHQKVVTLVKLLSTQTANLINYSNLAQQTSLNIVQVKGVLSILEKTFLIKLLKPFFSNKQLEIVKNPKVFFIDSGIRNAILDDFSTHRIDRGILYESFVFEELTKQDIKTNFWRSKTKAEVDFIIQLDNKTIPIEVKSGFPKITRSLKSFINHYNPKTCFIFNNEVSEQSEINSTSVYKQYFSQAINIKERIEKLSE